jgi:hypothetical protein
MPRMEGPLPQPVRRQAVNPFTKKAIEITTTAPDPAEPFDPGATKHADVARLHRVDLKGLGTVEMEELVRVVLERPEQHAANVYDMPLHGPPGGEEVIFRMPPALIHRLAGMDAAALAKCLEQWNKAVGRNLQRLSVTWNAEAAV